MQKIYILIFIFLLCAETRAQNQVRIKRASLSTSVIGSHNIQKGQYKVQQSIAHMGIMTLSKHDKHIVTRGFLLPQRGVSTPQPILDFVWLVYPNPFDTHVNIDFITPVSGDMIVRLHDIVGQLILEREMTAKQQQRVHLGNLAQAEYIITVELMGKTLGKTLINYKHPNKVNETVQ